jgi:hypothetical protein|tara:strand:+ start:175 stop:459 length:285 start_codon:yes stop_codon:yes gene_type:complete
MISKSFASLPHSTSNSEVSKPLSLSLYALDLSSKADIKAKREVVEEKGKEINNDEMKEFNIDGKKIRRHSFHFIPDIAVTMLHELRKFYDVSYR